MAAVALAAQWKCACNIAYSAYRQQLPNAAMPRPTAAARPAIMAAACAAAGS